MTFKNIQTLATNQLFCAALLKNSIDSRIPTSWKEDPSDVVSIFHERRPFGLPTVGSFSESQGNKSLTKHLCPPTKTPAKVHTRQNPSNGESSMKN